jgi:hypothetical protein
MKYSERLEGWDMSVLSVVLNISVQVSIATIVLDGSTGVEGGGDTRIASKGAGDTCSGFGTVFGLVEIRIEEGVGDSAAGYIVPGGL